MEKQAPKKGSSGNIGLLDKEDFCCDNKFAKK